MRRSCASSIRESHNKWQQTSRSQISRETASTSRPRHHLLEFRSHLRLLLPPTPAERLVKLH
jgi:hypothetical protein